MIFVGVDEKGKRRSGTLGDEFSVPEDFSQKTALKILRTGFAEAVEEKKETAVKEVRKTAVKSPVAYEPIKRLKTVKKKRK